jgi:hypothetical protein
MTGGLRTVACESVRVKERGRRGKVAVVVRLRVVVELALKLKRSQRVVILCGLISGVGVGELFGLTLSGAKLH